MVHNELPGWLPGLTEAVKDLEKDLTRIDTAQFVVFVDRIIPVFDHMGKEEL
jgi:hypothetical protein